MKKKNTSMINSLIVATAVALLPAMSPAQPFVVDFDDGVNPFSGGTLSTEQSFSGTTSLFLDMGESAVLEIPSELKGGDVTVSMMVFDMGKWIDRTVPGYPTAVYGSRWGVSTAPGDFQASMGLSIIERTFLGSAAGYGVGIPTELRFANSWFSPTFFGGSSAIRQNAPWMSDNGGTNPEPGEPPSSTWEMGTPGEGAWLKTTFAITAAGEVTITLEDVEREISVEAVRDMFAPAEEVWVWGGRDHATLGLPLSGIFIDDVVVMAGLPDPPLLPGDANRDGRVDGEDFLIWQASFSTQEGATWDDGDFNGDGRVDGEDFLIWQAHFGSVAQSSAVTPEPAALGLLGLLGIGLLARRRHAGRE